MAADDDLVEVRLLVPRSAFAPAAPAAELVSQDNALDRFGLEPRRFLEIVRAPSFRARVLRIGRLRLVRREDLLAHLEQIDESVARKVALANDQQAESPSLADRLGLEETPRYAARRAKG